MLSDKQVLFLRENLEKKGYCVVNNLIHPELVKFLQTSTQIVDTQTNKEFDKYIPGGDSSIATYKHPIGESLLLYLLPIYNLISGKELIPTYSFYRTYFKGNCLKKHTDRPACQYSITTQINRSKNTPWPFYLKDKQNNIIGVECNLGDVVFYKGEEVEHWREELDYSNSTHLFIHYVDKNNPSYKKEWGDIGKTK